MIQVRQAKPKDYEAVLAILPHIYNGGDYLPATFHSYFSDPQAHPYVTEMDGKVVAFANCYVVDNGETAVPIGLRSSPEYRNQGLTTKAKSASLDAAKAKFPNLKMEVSTVCDSTFYEQYRRANAKGIQVTYEKAYLQYSTTGTQLLQLLDQLERKSECERKEETSCIHDKADILKLAEFLLQSGLFPEKSFVIQNHWLPLKVTKQNHALACSITDVVVSQDSLQEKLLYTGVCFGSYLELPRGAFITMYFHVSAFNELLLQLKTYLQYNKQRLSQETPDVVLELVFPMDVPLGKIKEVLSPIVGENTLYDESYRERLLILEKPLA